MRNKETNFKLQEYVTFISKERLARPAFGRKGIFLDASPDLDPKKGVILFESKPK